MKDDDGPPTPIEGSGAYPVLRVGALELAEKLKGRGPDHEATRLHAQLLALAALMGAWTREHRPTEDERRAIVDELVDATKRANAILGRGP